jgi:hypothetical protein
VNVLQKRLIANRNAWHLLDEHAIASRAVFFLSFFLSFFLAAAPRSVHPQSSSDDKLFPRGFGRIITDQLMMGNN